jgi:hypothetical protein
MQPVTFVHWRDRSFYYNLGFGERGKMIITEAGNLDSLNRVAYAPHADPTFYEDRRKALKAWPGSLDAVVVKTAH